MKLNVMSNNPLFMKYLLVVFLFFSLSLFSQEPAPFISTPLSGTEDLSLKMVNGMNSFLDRLIYQAPDKRPEFWHRDFSSPQAYSESVESNRRQFASIIGAVDKREAEIIMEFISNTTEQAIVSEDHFFKIFAIRWKVFDNIHGEGLLLQPKGTVKNRVVVIPDADQIPEMLTGIYPGLAKEMQYARHLAENGSQVIIPTIINRSCELSGNIRLNRLTNQPHREWIYRQAYTFGRHIIGYEVQKILAAVDWFDKQNEQYSVPIGVLGWGEGGLLAFYSAALDTRINVALVSGYFNNRNNLWQEPIYRNLSGILTEFGDAEIAGMIVPRKLIIEYANFPEISGPPNIEPGPGRAHFAAAPGRIITPAFTTVKEEVERAITLAGPYGSSIMFFHDNENTVKPVSNSALLAFLQLMGLKQTKLKQSDKVLFELRKNFNPEKRQHTQIQELEQHIQHLIEKSRHVRDDFFWKNMKTSTIENWQKDTAPFQNYFREKITGHITESYTELNPRSRQIYDEPGWKGYEVTLDVFPDLFIWGYLLLPKDLKPGERRPVMVVMHGGSGVPSVVIDKENKTYKSLAAQIADRGYIVFSPHFPWKQGHDYRNLQRKANTVGLTIFSLMLPQHERLLDWLSSQPFVDSDKIGFYGLSWGGKVAVRIPALVNRYSLSICSGDFNEWIWKNASTDWQNTYMFVPEYEMFDFNLGMTFNYAEMVALIAPRAFMVERGHDDGVGIDEWVAFEYAKVKRLYDKLNIPHMTDIEYFNGGHEINAVGSLKFIERHFGLPSKTNQ